MKSYKILTDLDKELEGINAKRALAEQFIKLAEKDAQAIREAWDKYDVVDVDTTNISFKDFSEGFTSCVVPLIVKFSKPVTHIQMVNRMKLIGKEKVRFFFSNSKYDHTKFKYVEPSDKVTFNLYYQITK